MDTLKARVVNGRLVLDEPIDLPDGTVVELVVADREDEIDEAERAALDAALTESWTRAKKDDLIDADEVLRALDKRSR